MEKIILTLFLFITFSCFAQQKTDLQLEFLKENVKSIQRFFNSKKSSVTTNNRSGFIIDVTRYSTDKIDSTFSHTHNEYDSRGNKIKTTFGKNRPNIICYSYDENSNLTEQIDYGSLHNYFRELFDYDCKNNKTRHHIYICEDGKIRLENITTFEYDENNKVIFEKLCILNKLHLKTRDTTICYMKKYTYDDKGNNVEIVETYSKDSVISKVVNKFDERNRMIKGSYFEPYFPASIYKTSYDSSGNEVERQHFENEVLIDINVFKYSKENLLEEETNFFKEVFLYKYDKVGNVILRKCFDVTGKKKWVEKNVIEYY